MSYIGILPILICHVDHDRVRSEQVGLMHPGLEGLGRGLVPRRVCFMRLGLEGLGRMPEGLGRMPEGLGRMPEGLGRGLLLR